MEEVVNLNPPAIVGLHPNCVQVELRGRAGAPRAAQNLVAHDLLAAHELHPNALAAGVFDQLDAIDFLAEPQRDPLLAQMVGKRLDYLGIDKGQQARALLDHGDADAKRGEHARILASDHARADHGERLRQTVHQKDVVAGEDAAPVQRHPGIAHRFGSHRQQHLVGGDLPHARAVAEIEPQSMRVLKRSLRMRQLDVVALQLMAHHVDFMADHRVDPKEQVLQGDFFLDLVGLAVDRVFAIAGEIEHRLAHGLARNRADVHAGSADDRLALDDHHALAQLGRLNRGVMTRRAGPDRYKVIFEVSHPNSSASPSWGRIPRGGTTAPYDFTSV